jgi:acyl-CoA thioesterase FadM
MARVKLKLPEKFVFSTEVQVRISDINYGGHLGNDSLLSLIHEARVRFLNKHGFTELNIDGLGLIMIDAVIIYKSEVFYGEKLKIEVTVDGFDKHGCDFYYKITKVESNREVARAKTGIVFLDYETKKIATVPDEFKSLFTTKSK